MVSYDHHLSTSKKWNLIDRIKIFIFYKLYDRIIFYTKVGKNLMLEKNLISKNKAYYANNTIFSKEVDSVYKFSYPDDNKITILFIGRLVKRKKLPLLIDYFISLKNKFKDQKKVELVIIGDGPLKKYILKIQKYIAGVKYVGSIVDESLIVPT